MKQNELVKVNIGSPSVVDDSGMMSPNMSRASFDQSDLQRSTDQAN
jgi:hypothetical protein